MMRDWGGEKRGTYGHALVQSLRMLVTVGPFDLLDESVSVQFMFEKKEKTETRGIQGNVTL